MSYIECASCNAHIYMCKTEQNYSFSFEYARKSAKSGEKKTAKQLKNDANKPYKDKETHILLANCNYYKYIF